MNKICSKCKVEKKQAEFSGFEFEKNGYYKSCKRIWYKNNKTIILHQHNKYYINNQDSILEYAHYSLFNYLSITDKRFKECWVLNNLRPLNAKQDAIKNNRNAAFNE